MRKHVSAAVGIILMMNLMAAMANATTLDITTTDFVQGGEIKSSSFVTMASEIETWANGNVGTDNIPDSGITANMMGANSVNATHLAAGAVRARNIDSGAIQSDTMFAPGWTLPTTRFVSSTDTVNNFTKQITGLFQGSGTDTRIIYNTAQMNAAAPQAASGVNIPFTVTYVEVFDLTNSAGRQFIGFDAIGDSGALESAAGGYTFARHTATQALTHGPGTYGTFVNNSDSHGFRITNAGSVTNAAGVMYGFVVRGY